MSKRAGANKENYEETQRVFLAFARIEFATHGYLKASTTSIVEQSGMARGSLYYHFRDKEDLFRKVFVRMTEESGREIREDIAGITDPLEALKKGAEVFYTHCLDPVFRRIVLIEALVAIPYPERVALISKSYSELLVSLISNAQEAGKLPKTIPASFLAVMIHGILAEHGRTLEFSQDPERAKCKLVEIFNWTFDRLCQS